MKNYIAAILLGLFATFVLMTILLPQLKRLKAGQQILQYVTEHKGKQGTPTMGGIAFVVAFAAISLVLLSGKDARLAYVCIAMTVGYGIIGFLDDYIKIKYKRNMGLSAIQKVVFQLALAVIAALVVYNDNLVNATLWLPFTNDDIFVGWWIVPLVVIIFLACVNGVNLTDGLDGLAASSTIVYLVLLSVILIIKQSQSDLSGKIQLMNQQNSLTIICLVMTGALLAFLFFNCFPAKVFMGDTGSLALGGLVASVSVFSQLSLVIPLIGISFVVSCLSVILQVLYFKVTKGKRLFLMAPLHHHLQMKGFSETRISVLYCIVMIAVGLIVIIVSFGNLF